MPKPSTAVIACTLLSLLGAAALAAAKAGAGDDGRAANATSPASLPGAASAPSPGVAATPAPAPAQQIVDGVDIGALIAGMTVEQKVGQLLFVDFAGLRMNRKLANLVAGKRVGGVALFSRNIKARPQVRKLVRDITALNMGGIPPFVSVDQEGGKVVRIKDPEAVLPSAMALGATRSVELASTAGRVVGRDLRSLGITMNLAPVLDVNSNPQNPVIGIRSFGERPELVGEIGLAFIDGMRQAGIIAVAKHFPGHGATASDSHYGLPSLDVDMDQLRRTELLPFAHTIRGGLEALMTAHIALPKIAEAPDLPSTLSRRILTDTLRGELGFDGIVITDGLEMRSIVARYGLGPAAVQAIVAGADMVLVVWTSGRKEEVRQALLAAVADGTISEARLDQSVRRILAAKARHHVFPGQAPISTPVSDEDRRINNVVAMRAATLVRNQGGILPLRPERAQRVLVAGHSKVFRQLLKKRLGGAVAEVALKWAPTRERRGSDTKRLLAKAAKADVVVVGLSNLYYKQAVRKLKQAYPDKPVVVVSFGSPYMLSHFPAVDAYLCLYSNLDSAQVAAVATLVGENPPTGKLPVTLPELYGFDHGLSFAAEAEPSAHQGRRTRQRVPPKRLAAEVPSTALTTAEPSQVR